jgi:hypothetical protein
MALTVAPFGPVIPWGPRAPWLPCKVDRDQVTWRMPSPSGCAERGNLKSVPSGSWSPRCTDHTMQELERDLDSKSLSN